MSESNQLSEQIDACKRRLLETVERIRALLIEDVKGYPERELRRRFMLDTVRSEAISDGELASLRVQVVELGVSLAEALEVELSPEAPWLQVSGEIPEKTRDLRDLPSVWKLVSIVDEGVEALAESFNLGGDDREPAGYQPPARFIGGQHLPSLVETWVRELQNLRELSYSLEVEVVERRQRSLSARWAKAAPEQ